MQIILNKISKKFITSEYSSLVFVSFALSICNLYILKMKREKIFFRPNLYALVTGASSGMGREYLFQLTKMGYNVIAVSNQKEALEDAVNEAIGSFKIDQDQKIVPLFIDLSQLDAYKEVIEFTKDFEIEVLINNAGVMICRPLTLHSEEEITRLISLHDHTIVQLSKYFSKKMADRGEGYIMNISSLAAWLQYPVISIYSASKVFIKSFTRSLRCELYGSGVKVTTAYFGAVDTPLYPLSQKYRKIARRLGIMISAEKASKVALKALFKGKANVMPGFINRLFRPILPIIPKRVLNFAFRKAPKSIYF